MGAFTLSATPVLRQANDCFQKKAVISIVGPASYDTGGSVIDLSALATALASDDAVFTRVDGVAFLGSDSAAGARYQLTYLRAASGAPSTGKLVATTAGAEASGNLSALVFRIEVTGA
jgi:hypothetical protein